MNELLLLCTIAGRPAAIPAVRVQSVIEVETITEIPGTPEFILGLTALRSQALTVIDCALAIGLDEGCETQDRRAAVVEIEGHLYALMVDAAHDVGQGRSEPIAVPGGFGEGWQRAAHGMVETEAGPTLLIDVEQLVSGPIQQAA